MYPRVPFLVSPPVRGRNGIKLLECFCFVHYLSTTNDFALDNLYVNWCVVFFSTRFQFDWMIFLYFIIEFYIFLNYFI